MRVFQRGKGIIGACLIGVLIICKVIGSDQRNYVESHEGYTLFFAKYSYT